MSNVRRIDAAKTKPDPVVVQELERLLALARVGEITCIVVLVEEPSKWTYLHKGLDACEIVGRVELFKAMIIRGGA